MKTRFLARWLTFGSLTVLLVGCPGRRRPEPAPRIDDERIIAPGLGRSCQSKLILIDYLPDEIPDDYAQALGRVAESMQAQVQERERAESFLAGACGAEGVRVAFSDVFAGAPGIAEPLRHQVMRFYCGDAAGRPGESIPIRPEAQCRFMQELQTSFIDALSEGLPERLPAERLPVEITRDCDATSQQLGPEWWHLASIGDLPPIDRRSPVMLAIADDGADHARRVREVAESVLEPPPPVLDNATVIEGVTVRSIRVLDPARGGTPTSAIARDLGRFVSGLTPNDPPVVLNLSFGWPPEMGAYAKLRGDRGCQFREAPVGRSVARVLAALKRKSPKSLVFAASGNRNQRVDFPGDIIEGPGRCGPVGAGDPLPFYPAAWAWPAPAGCGPLSESLTLAVGMHGVEPTEGNLGVAEPVFYAPGRQLTIPVAPAELGTGTSYATAVASGVAARVLLGVDPGQPVGHKWFVDTHTCIAPGATLRRLRVGAADPCRQPGMSLAPAPPSPCTGSACTEGKIGTMTTSRAGIRLPPDDLTEFDVFSLGGAAPQPDVPICLGGPCRVLIDPAAAVVDLYLQISPFLQKASKEPYATGVVLRIYDGTQVHDYPIEEALVGGETYSFSGLGLPADLKTTEALKAALFVLRYKLVDGSSTAWREDPLARFFK